MQLNMEKWEVGIYFMLSAGVYSASSPLTAWLHSLTVCIIHPLCQAEILDGAKSFKPESIFMVGESDF